MPYTVRYTAKDRIAAQALGDLCRERPNYAPRGSAFRYFNLDTGTAFALARDEDGAGLTLTIEVPRPPFFAIEAETESSALVAALELEVPAHADEGDGAYSTAAFVRDYARENAAAHSTLIGAETDFYELPTTELLPLWRWNLGRAAIEASFRGVIAVPRIDIAVHPDTGQVCTVAELTSTGPVLLPAVDVVVFDMGETKRWIATSEIDDLLRPLGIQSARFRYRVDDGLREAGLAHYDLSKHEDVVSDMLARADANGTAPQRVPMTSVVARELARLGMGIAAPRRADTTDPAARFPRECRGFWRTRRYELARVLGGYTWLSPWKLESIALSEARPIVAGVGAGGVVFFDRDSGKRLRELVGDVYAGASVGLSDDGKTIAIGTELGTLDVYDVDLEAVGAPIQKRAAYAALADDGAPPHGHVLGVSPDGSVVIGAVGDDIVVMRDGEEPTTFRATGAVCASRDLSRIWTGNALVDVTTERAVIELPLDPKAVRVPALSPDGRYLAFANSKAELLVVRIEDGMIVSLLPRKDSRGAPSIARFIAFTPDGSRLIVGDSSGLEIRQVPSLELEKSFAIPMWDAAVSNEEIYRVVDERIWTQPIEKPAPPVNDGPITQLFHSARSPIALATSTPGEAMTGGRAVLWFLPTGTVLRATERLCPDRVNLTPDGRHLCLATESALLVLDVGTLETIRKVEPLGDQRYVRPIDLDASPDGEHVLACLEDGLARMVSIQTGLDVWRADLGIKCATFTPDGRNVVAGDASRLRVIDAATGAVLKEIAIEDPRPEGEHVLIRDGGAAVRVAADTGIAIVDLETEESEVVAFPGAREVLAASPDGQRVAVLVDGEESSDVVLCSIDTREEVDRISLRSAEDTPVSAAFSPDGKNLLVGTSRGALLVFAARA